MARRRWWLAVAVLCLVIVVAEVPVMRAPFGDSRDGVNGAVWGFSARALRRAPLGSHFGATAKTREPETYVNHPPLVIAEVALVESVVGERHWATRLPALTATLVALALLMRIAREADIGLGAAVAGVALAFGSPLVRTYGSMLDTPIVGLAPAMAVLLLWQRRRSGRAVGMAWWAAVVALTCLSSWLGWLLCGLVGLGLLLGRRWRDAAAVAAGGSLAAILYLVWLVQAGTGPADLRAIFVERSRGENSRQVDLLASVPRLVTSSIPPWTLVLVVPMGICALRHQRLRGPVIVAWATAITWEVVFPFRAATEEFWLWWTVPAVALSLMVGLHMVNSRLAAKGATSWRRPVAVALGALAAVGLFAPSQGWRRWASGVDAGSLLSQARLPASQKAAYVLTANVADTAWVPYEARRPARGLLPEDVHQLAAVQPEALVLTLVALRRNDVSNPPAQCLTPAEREGRYALVRADRLASLLGSAPGCPLSP